MARRIDIAQAITLVQSRTRVMERVGTGRELEKQTVSGELVRVHRGSYIDGEVWRQLWPEGQHLLRVIAVHRASPAPGPVFCGTSAAVLWGLPFYRVADVLVHVFLEGSRHSRVAAGVARHQGSPPSDDIVLRHGIRCTSLARTVADLARTLRPEAALCAGDAALRSIAIRGTEYSEDDASEWKAELARHWMPGMRGVNQARWVGDFLDGRAQLPGESVSRLQLRRLGFEPPMLQVPVVGAHGDRYFMDFGFRRSRRFGEFDGEGKYLEPELRTAPTPIDAVLAEKRREDDVRGVTGWAFARWGGMHIRTAAALGARLAAFGVVPPG